jgi:hypothetical protein
MAAGLTIIVGADASTPTRIVLLLAGSDGTNVSPGHTLFDINGVPFGTSGNPISASDAVSEAALGTPADVAWAGTGTSTIIAALKSLYGRLAGTLSATLTGALPAGGNAIGSVSVTGTVAVSDSAGEASLATVATQTTASAGATGTAADAAYTTGGGSVIAVLKGIFGKLAGTLAVTGTFWQTTQPVTVSPFGATDGSATITAGGSAQNLFGGTTPTNGFGVYNPDPLNDLWISDSTTAAANGLGSIRVAANGGAFETALGYKPLGIVSVYGGTTNQKITAKRW